MARKRRGDRQNYGSLYELMVSDRYMKTNQAANRTQVLERMYMRVLGELAMSRFEWKGFEGTGVDVRYLEMQLFYHALAVVFKDSNEYDNQGKITYTGTDQIYALKGSPSGQPNLVDNPTAFTVTGTSFTGKRLSIARCVPIWANNFRVPDLDIVMVYANTFAEMHRTIEINSANARRSKILTYNENSRLTVENVNDMVDSGQSSIPVNMQLGDIVQALDLGVDPKGIEVLSIVKSRVWNECMSLLGINNANHEKKERVQSAEVEANNDQVGSARRVNLNARQHAAKKINEMFDMNVSVDYYTNLPVETINPATNEQTSTLE